MALLAVLFVAALWIEHRSAVTLPAPTGPFAVGRTLFDWRGDPGTERELLVWIWYPAAPQAGAVFDDYLPRSIAPRASRRPGLLGLLTRDADQVHGHSVRNAEVSPQQFPVAIMRAGASAPVVNYSTLAEDLASHGYVVVGFDAAYRTGRIIFPDGRVIDQPREDNPELDSGDALNRLANKLIVAWSGDIAFVRDRLAQLNSAGQFAHRIDLTRVGVFGHSFGGATSLQFCHDDPRCKAAIDIDGAPFGSVVQSGIDTPVMFLLSDHGDVSADAEGRQVMANIRSIYDRLPQDRRLFLVIRGANHFTFSDDGALRKSGILRGMLRLFGKLKIDGRRQLVVTASCVHTFFDVYLKGANAAQLRSLASRLPELRPVE